MFGLKKIGTAVAIVALTSFGAIGANAAIITGVDSLVGGVTTLSLSTDTQTVANGSADRLTGGTLNIGDTFSEGFVVNVNDVYGTGHVKVEYNFGVLDPNGASAGGVANLRFRIFQNGDLVNDFQITGATGTLLASPIVNAGPGLVFPQTFIPVWNVGDVISYNVSGTILGGGQQPQQGGLYTVNITAVPLPASVLMLVGALAGLGFVGRMKRSRLATA